MTTCMRFSLRLLVLVGVVGMSAAEARASKVILKIEAANPSDKPQTVLIKSNLPGKVGTNDVISTGGLDLRYDVKNNVYYVQKEVELRPKEITSYSVEIRDIWVVPREELDKLRAHVAALVAKLQNYEEQKKTATALAQEVEKTFAQIDAYQEENSIKKGVKPVDHIRAYEAAVKRLSGAKVDIGRIENLVLSTEQDPGQLLGEVKASPKPRPPDELPEDAYKTATIRIMVRNTSPTETRKVSVDRDLPVEVKAYDVLDAGGLEIVTDPKQGVCFVHGKDIEIPPGETRTFNVKIRDKWNVNGPRIRSLLTTANDLLSKVGAKERFESVERLLKEVIGDLTRMDKEQGPATLNSEYVAFYRDQAARLDEVEKKVNRIQSALVPAETPTRLGFNVKPPSMKTTWLIIYVILGFLALLSILFFLRWFGKSKAEKA